MAQDGIYSSRFGVNGTEDLGGGLKANFHFEGGLTPDDGTAKGLTFMRKSVIGVSGNFGEVRLGRDYTPLFTVAGIADPFGTNGVGSSYNVANSVTTNVVIANAANAGSFATAQGAVATTVSSSTVAAGTVYADPNAVRANNSVTYYSPSFSGFTVSGMYSFGAENTNLAKDSGSMTSVKLAYANGPVAVAYANQVTKGGVVATAAADSESITTNFLAGSYDLGVAKLSAGYKTDKASFYTETFKSTILGVVAPMGALTLKASFVTRSLGSDKVADQVAFGGVYDLSKRTSVYATYSTLNNEAGYGMNVGSALASDFSGLTSKGFEAGVKHSF
jgi:predicted porin